MLARQIGKIELYVDVEVEDRLGSKVLRLYHADRVETRAWEVGLLDRQLGMAGLVEPLIEKAPEAPARYALHCFAEIVDVDRLASMAGQKPVQPAFPCRLAQLESAAR